ncbi:dihydrolipoyl dehydrogenase [Rickettsiales bacterium]|nr:dihydrolipoyl dehydrogenase [Rickettsiales bacterium]
MSSNHFDVCVIGGGPGGYVAAIRCAQLGLNVCLVEKENLGGVCLNWGCIPTKALLKSGEVYSMCSRLSEFGINSSSTFSPDIKKMVQRSRDIACKLSGGVSHLMKKNNIKIFSGNGQLIDANTVKVTSADKTENINCKKTIIATGGRAREIPGFEADGDVVWNYRHALVPESLPKSMLIVGSGAIGLEFASFYNAIGVDVTVLESMDRILVHEDEEISLYARKCFEEKGIKFIDNVKLLSCKKIKNGVEVVCEQGGKKHTLNGEKLLMAVGVVANIDNIGLHNVNAGVEGKRIKVSKYCETTTKGIFAIGDVNDKGPFLAHKASHEGIMVAECIASDIKGGKCHDHSINYDFIPACTYTSPQIASIGLTQKQAKEQGINFNVGSFKFNANGKAIAVGEEEGFAKVMFDKDTGELVGAHLIGAEVTEMIHSFSIAKESEITVEALSSSVFPHPTISETVHESILSALNKVIHS